MYSHISTCKPFSADFFFDINTIVILLGVNQLHVVTMVSLGAGLPIGEVF